MTEKFLTGEELRNEFIDNFSSMMRPVRIMLDMDRSKLAQLSGLPEELITNIEEGHEKLSENNFLSLAAVFSNMKFSVDEKIYRAMIKILTSQIEIQEKAFDDFELLKIWLETYNESDDKETASADEEKDNEFIDDDDEVFGGIDLEQTIGEYSLIADETAAADENFPALLTRLEPLMKKAEVMLVIPDTILEKIRYEIQNGDADERYNLSSALNYLRRKQEEKLIKIIPSSISDCEDVENSLLDIMEDGTKYLLITQDYVRSENMTLNAENIISAHIDDNGDLILWEN